ncbi:MAG: YHYH protein [Verrucomicrobiales bacterium]
MKNMTNISSIKKSLLMGAASIGVNGLLPADPILSSWYTEGSGRYARIWETGAAEAAERGGAAVSSVTTWNFEDYADVNSGAQLLPVYAGVQGVSYSSDYVYIKSTGLANSTMGPWFRDGSRTTMFTGFPANGAYLTRFPRSVSYPSTYQKSSSSANPTGLGVAGLSVDGVPLFDSSDGQSYNRGGVWNQDAYYNEGGTFDSGFAHQNGGRFHYHSYSPALRHLLGDSVDYDPSVVFTGPPLGSTGTSQSPYTENFNGTHSPIIGWMLDGLPLYGPYGYGDPKDSTSAVRRMISGYQQRDGSNGSVDLATTGRTSLPLWVTYMSNRSQTISTAGPTLAERNLGRYYEDNAYKGDLISDATNTPMEQYVNVSTQGAFDETKHFDLNAYNVRWCVTPEFPTGTWAYFTNIDADGSPVFPYNLAKNYWGDSSLASNIEASQVETTGVVVLFEGAASIPPTSTSVSVENGDITLTWSIVEGGSYRIDTSSDLANWNETATPETAGPEPVSITEAIGSRERMFYRLTQAAELADYDTTPFSTETNARGGGGPR